MSAVLISDRDTHVSRALAAVRLRPFGGVALFAIALLPVSGHVAWLDAGAGIALGLGSLGAAVALPRLAADRRAHVLAFVWLVAIALVRDATGGAHGGYGVLVQVPVLWVALYGSPRQLAATLAGVAALLFAPLIFFAGPAYPAAGWRSAPLLLLCCATTGLVVQELLARNRKGVARRARLLDAIGDGVIVTDVTGTVLEVNDALCRMTGFAADEIVGQRAPLPSWRPEDHLTLMASHAAAIARGGGEIEARLITKDGDDLHTLIALAVSADPGEAPTVIATVKDVTDRVALSLRLAEELERSTLILQSTSEGFCLTRDSRIIDVNPALCRLTGFTREQLIDTEQPYPFSPPEAQKQLHELRRQVYGSDGGVFDVPLMRADGTRFVGECTTTPVKDHDGRLSGFLTAIRDVTERRRAADEAQETSRRLAVHAGITRSIAHAEPRHARRVVCETAMRITGANTATIWEADADGVLHNRCMVGAQRPDFTVGADQDHLDLRRAYRSGVAIFVAAASASPDMERRMAKLVDFATVHFQPIVGESDVIGVLVLSWQEHVAQLGTSREQLVELLAHEASVGIARAASHDALESLARTDALTGTTNRRAGEEALARKIADCERTLTPLSVVMIDLDHFKAFNDAHGHPCGDALLRAATAAWSRRLRDSDVLARWGGEEFCLLLDGCDAATAQRVVAHLLDVMPEDQTFSAGIAGWRDGATPESLVADADRALYEAKRRGRNRSVVAGDLPGALAA